MNSDTFEDFSKKYPFIAEISLRRPDGQERDLSQLAGIVRFKPRPTMFTVTPFEHLWDDNSFFALHAWHEIDFVLQDGTIIKNAVKRHGETFMDAILRLEVLDTLAHIVRIDETYTVGLKLAEPTFYVSIYTLPTDVPWWTTIISSPEEPDLLN